jgi:hypothetical protein
MLCAMYNLDILEPLRGSYPVRLASGSGISRESSRIYFWNLQLGQTDCDFQKCLRLTRSYATTAVWGCKLKPPKISPVGKDSA